MLERQSLSKEPPQNLFVWDTTFTKKWFIKGPKTDLIRKTFQFRLDCKMDSNISKVEYSFLDWSGALRQDEQMTSWFIGSNIHYFMCAIFKLNMFLLKEIFHNWLTDQCLNGVVPKCPNARIKKFRIGGIIVFATEKGVSEAYFRKFTMWILIFQWGRGNPHFLSSMYLLIFFYKIALFRSWWFKKQI